jgi:6,7-dimethyl-8-ribityllumazine synthase
MKTQNVDAIIVIDVIKEKLSILISVCEGVTQGIKDLNVQSDVQ